IGPGHWDGIDHLNNLRLPEDDRGLIVTVHYYSPLHFTHQNASWISGSTSWTGTTWTGTKLQRQALARDFEGVATWARQNQRPVYVGEFGAYQAADLPSRARWTAAVVRAARRYGFSWAYWEFCAGFGAYDPRKNVWRKPLLHALITETR